MDFDSEIAARTVWMEARGEIPDGQRAVANVLVNRSRAGMWYSGKTLAEACLMPYQFSCWNTSDPNRISSARLPMDSATLIQIRTYIDDALSKTQPDPTFGCTHYYNPKAVVEIPKWAKGMKPIITIGNHQFFRGVK